MADINSPILDLLLMQDGLHSNNWGDNSNANLTIIENAVKGLVTLNLSGDTAISQANAAYQTLIFTGPLSNPATITMPQTANVWKLWNKTGGTLTIKTGAAGGAVGILPTGFAREYITDGTDIISSQSSGHAIGEYKHYASLTPPVFPDEIWMLCNGAAISRTTYAAWFNLVGTKFGAGDGSTTANLPDYNGRTFFQDDNGSGRLGLTTGQSGGNALGNVILSVGNIPSHTHGVNDPSHSHGVMDPWHGHTVVLNNGGNFWSSNGGYQSPNNGYTGLRQDGANAQANRTGITIYGSYTGISIQSTGSTEAFNTLPPLLTGGGIFMRVA